MCKSFDVIKLKSMYGKEYLGVDRSTFLISSDGKVVKEWRSVKLMVMLKKYWKKLKTLKYKFLFTTIQAKHSTQL